MRPRSGWGRAHLLFRARRNFHVGTARRRAFAHPTSRGTIRAHVFVLARHISSEVCNLSLLKKREAERRQAPGCIGTRFVRGPLTQVRASPRREAFTVCAPGDARLSALHRGDLLAAGPARDESFAMLPSLSNHWACEHLASARNGGGRVSGGLPGDCVHAQTRGTPHPALLKQCLAKAPSADGTSPM